MQTLTPPAAMLELQRLRWTVDLAPRALKLMRRDARKWSPLETVGAILSSRNGDNVTIELAVPAGPHAEHKPLTAYPDEVFWNRWLKRLWKANGLTMAGQWHTHPFQNAPSPSPFDQYGLAQTDGDTGWFDWDRKYRDGTGHFEVIMARRMTRVWYVRGSDDGIWLMQEVPIGIE